MTHAHDEAGDIRDGSSIHPHEVRFGTPDSELDFEPYLYNRPEHLTTQRRKNPFSAGLVNKVSRRWVAVLHADHTGSEAQSLAHAPFGGIQALSGLPAEALGTLLSEAEQWCGANHLSRLTIKSPPTVYDEKQHAILQEVYEKYGFTVQNVHRNHHIRVTADAFIDKIHPCERKRLRKCLRAGFTAGQWVDPDPERVYGFLLESRKRQGYALALEYEQLRRLLVELSGSVRVFAVRDGERLTSLTVAIRVNSRILYNFCPADHLAYRQYSPAVLLNAALYEYAQSEGIELIDLGVSLDHLGLEKNSLVRFKENLGAEQSVKITYEKVFSRPSTQPRVS